MNEQDIKHLVDQAAREAAQQAVREALLTLGIDATEAREIQADMLHVRKWREATETVKKQSLLTAVGVITAAILGLIWLAVRGG